MVYTPQNAKEQPGLPSDVVFDGVITKLRDGKVSEIVTNLENWKGDPNSPCIEVAMEVTHKEKKFEFTQIFTYEEEDGKTVYSPRSNLGKYKAKYGKLPESADQIKAMTNKDGFLKLKLD